MVIIFLKTLMTRKWRLVEKTKAHVIVGRLLLGSLLGGSGTTGSGVAGRSGSSRGSLGGGKGLGVAEERLQGRCHGEGVVLHGQAHGQNVLVAVDEHVRRRGQRRVANGERHGGNLGDGRLEVAEDVLARDVEHSGGVQRSVVVDLHHDQTVVERLNVEHAQHSGVGGTDLLALSDDLHVRQNLNGSTRNLGGNRQSLEERRLLGSQCRDHLGEDHVNGSDGTGLSGSTNTVGLDNVADLGELTVGEDEANVLDNIRQQLLEVGVGLELGTDRLAHHGVLAHEKLTLSAQSNTDVLHLARTNVVGMHNHKLAVLVQQSVDLREVSGLAVVASCHLSLEMREGP
mmetsp:Transcript_16755/g.52533  ORF Transcript_16755/g.52533 Transcript_16755/m.52533 type:complete len:343 (+) Transcript_16755:109-1137(+)